MDEKLHPKLSFGGKNAYYHHCDHYGGMPNYGVCLHIIKAHQEKRLIAHESCVTAFRNNTCPAIPMRREELEKREAIYYKPPRVLTESQKAGLEALKRERYEGQLPRPEMLCNPSYVRGWNQAGKDDSLDIPTEESKHRYVAPPKVAKPKRVESGDPEFTNVDYGKMVNDMSGVVHDE